MPPRKKRPHIDVMVSSTSRDLPEHREAVMDAILRMEWFPLVMETLTASPYNAIRYSLQMVDDAEVYIGIFGFRYGYRPDDPEHNPNKVSITELEFRRAVERGIPILIFLMDDAHPVPVNAGEAEKFFEQDAEGKALLKKLKNEVGLKYVVGSFKSPDELKAKAIQALERLCRDKIINCEGEDASEDDAGKRLLPSPPAPYVAHDYILTRQFVGRRSELKQLDEWAASADTTLIVDAIGGIGKSALTWQWFNDHAKDFEASFWWSFYESDSAVTNFTRHALAYLQGKAVKDYDNTSAEERERELLALLRKKRCLFVLDGLERILTAYHRMDAPHLLDENAETEVPAAAGQITDPAQLRRCTDPRHAELLKKLTQAAPSKFLISTRLIPADLQDAGNLIPKVRELHLNGLADPDALALLQHLGVKGDGAQITLFTRQFGNHSLLLGIIAGRVNEYDPAPGNFDRWYADEGRDLRLQEVDLKQRRTNILAYALAGLPTEQRKLLAQIAAFRYPVDYATVGAFNPYAPPRPVEVKKPYEGIFSNLEMARNRLKRAASDAERATAEKDVAEEEAKLVAQKAAYESYQQALTKYPTTSEYRDGERQFRTALRLLQGRGLLQFDKEAGRYDLHPVVRAFALDDLQGDDRRGAYERIRDHFEKMPPEDLGKVQELSQLRRSLEIYYALIAAEIFDRAAQVYADRLGHVLYFHLAAYHTIIELLTPLFRNENNLLFSLTPSSDQWGCIADLSNALSYVGQLGDAMKLEETRISIATKYKSAYQLEIVLGNYSISLLEMNKLAQSIRACEIVKAIANISDHEALANLRMLDACCVIGDWIGAERHYQVFGSKPAVTNKAIWQSVAERLFCKMLIYQGKGSAESLTRAWDLATAAQYALGQREIHQLRGEMALQNGDPQRAIGHFNDSMTMAQKSGVSELDVSEVRGGLARAYALLGRHDEAQRMISMGVNDISCAEAHLTMGERQEAGERAIAAYEWAWADGEPYVRRWELERAKKVLAALGLEPPDLPPFDPAKVEPLPYETEILAFIEELKAEKAKKTAEQSDDTPPEV